MSLGKLRSWILTIPLCFFATAIGTSVAMLSIPFPKAIRWQLLVRRTWAATLMLIIGARGRARGLENLVPGQNYVIASNHQSLLDTPIMVGWMPMPFKFVAKRELLKVPFVGWYLALAGHPAVDRSSVRSALQSMNDAARIIRERRLSVLFFAEGTRSLDGTLQPFKDGAAYLAIASGAPLIPVALVGTGNILPAKSSQFHSGRFELRIGEPIPVQGYTLKDRHAVTGLLQSRVSDLLARPL